MNELRLLQAKLITIPKGAKKPSDEPPDRLDGPVETEGLYPPIPVRPDPAKQGHYLLISGEDRYHYAAKVLKQESIKCQVFKDMDEDEAQLAALSESVREKNTSNAERLELVGEWYKLYTKKYPELIGKRASGKSRWKNWEAKADESKLDAGIEPKAKPVAPPNSNRGRAEENADLTRTLLHGERHE